MNLDAVGLTARVRATWSEDDCLLYAVSLNCGAGELQFATENTEGVPQQVLPTFVTVIMDLAAKRGRTPQLAWFEDSVVGDFAPEQILDGERKITLHGPLPVRGSAEVTTRIAGIWDKGSGAVIELNETGVNAETGTPLWDHQMWAFVRGEGGWGGDPGPARERNEPPEREPDRVISYETCPNQAYLYRLNGDRARYHSDPASAQAAGFDRPLLHGLCSYGFAGRGLIEVLCDGDPARFGSMTGRFSAPVFPGDTLVSKMWLDGGGAVFRTENQDGVAVIDRGRFTFRG